MSQGELDASDRVLKDLTDLARLQVSELSPHELTVALVISAFEEDDVEMRIEARVGRGPLHDCDRVGLHPAHSTRRWALRVKREHSVDEDPGQR